MLLFLRRPLRIVTGYVAASLVAGFAMAAVVVAQLPDHSVREVVPNMVGATVAFARIAAIVGFLPSLVLVALCEWRGERRWWIYSIFTACLAAGAGAVISGGLIAPIDSGWLLTVSGGCAALGAVSGWIYWRLAGRFAGRDANASGISGRG